MKTIIDSCINGSSEMVSVLAFSVITILFNRILMNYGEPDGVASLSIIWYAQGLFGGLFRGYINGISSVVSYNLGRGDKKRLSRVFHISILGSHEELYHAMENGTVDLALNDQRRAFSDAYNNIILTESRLYIELSAKNPLSKLPSLEIADLKNTPCVLVINQSGQREEQEYYETVIGLHGELRGISERFRGNAEGVLLKKENLLV